MATVESIITRITHVTKDPDHVRFTIDEILLWINDAQAQIASLHPRASTSGRVITLAAGARQDLKTIDPSVRWLRLFEIICNCTGTVPDGEQVRQVPRATLSAVTPAWRKATASGTIKEYILDERDPYQFEVNPPATAGTKVYVLAAVKPADVAQADEFGLAEGYDIPVVDYVLSRLFSKDANDPSYVARAAAHLQLFQMAMGVETKDASAE